MHLSIFYNLMRMGLVVSLFIYTQSLTAQTQKADWVLYPAASSPLKGPKLNTSNKSFQMADLQVENLLSAFDTKTQEIWLPDGEGLLSAFYINYTSVVADEVANQYSLKTYRGYKKSDPTVLVACDVSAAGLRAAVLSADHSYFVEPIGLPMGKAKIPHIIYNKTEADHGPLQCGAQDHIHAVENHLSTHKSLAPNQKFTFRLAIAAAGEYAIAYGGSPVNSTMVLDALASGVNMVNLIYLRDLGIEFSLVSTAALVFSDPVTDPFDTNDIDGLPDAGHDVITNTLGATGFDVGHLVIWENLGGLASYNVVCEDFDKGRGFSGTDASISTLWIDYVCHELGHQFGASHNFSARECFNSEDGHRFEPGEGSSIMSYASICGPPVQYAMASDPFFHIASIEEIYGNNFNNLSAGQNQNCAVTSTIGNSDDPIAIAGDDIIIPRQTPFILVGEASDANDPQSALSYQWVQFNGNGSETIGLPNCALKDALFRFRPPTTELYRSFPQYTDVLLGNNNNIDFEKLPCIQRDMTFSFAVRDNNPRFGRVTHDLVKVTVANTGPFEVSQPNGGETLSGGIQNNITWMVNGTDSHCPIVDVQLSLDGGATYSIIANSIVNDGSEMITIPNNPSTTARLLISCAVGSIYTSSSTFYDVSNGDFIITQSTIIDNDGDNFDSSVDCDDNNPNVYPGAPEICNNIDDNCSSLIDALDPLLTDVMTYYIDADSDSYGDASVSIIACNPPAGYVTDNTDCNDSDASINPASPEICNNIDDNCSGLIDNADPQLTGATVYYADVDGDGYGNPQSTIMACTPPIGYVLDNSDCADNNPNINPVATEICNNIDDDCDGLIDSADPDLAGTAIWYQDADGDNYGNPNNSTASCSQPAGYVSDNQDCNDNNANINPLAAEICNGIDDDCDGLIDDNDPDYNGTTSTIWYIDLDGDQYGDPSNSTISCTQPNGYVANNLDCNDNNDDINPLAQEICNGIDDDCDGLIDGNDPSVSGFITYYADNDGDGYGNPSIPTLACNQPNGFVANNDDCNDGLTSVNPGAQEICNGVDDDCDGLIDGNDPDLNGNTAWYPDFDGDGYGNTQGVISDCTQPSGYVAIGGDCNDSNASINPGANETCNGLDDDCDGLIDDEDPSLTGAQLWYADADLDGYGNPAVFIQACNLQIGYVSNNEDCDDNNQNISPAAIEICNGVDDDCDGLIDDIDPSLSGGTQWYLDNDQDGYGNSSNSIFACNQPIGYVSNADDCDDNNNAIGLPSQEICNGIDDDCDGLIDDNDPDVQGLATWYSDFDGDGYGNSQSSLLSCSQPNGYVPNDLDCNDNNASVNPASTELCNGLDDDCDGLIDDNDPSIQGLSTWYIDADSDGYGSTNQTIVSCNQPQGYVPNDQDCNDNSLMINPAAGEICDNGLDDDCDGLIDGNDPDVMMGNSTWYLDSDGDGYGSGLSSIVSCNPPAGYVGNNQDCNDNNAGINPNANEICDNNIDDDCDGLTDLDDPDLNAVILTLYLDSDGDGYGQNGASVQACTPLVGYVSNNQDCNDTNPNINPDAAEICDNNIDEDCDGLVDNDDPDIVAFKWYGDNDGDGYGNPTVILTTCAQPAGYVLNDTDCNDSNANIYPGANEICDNGLDDDCDGLVDNDDPSVAGAMIWYEDLDGDGYGNTNTLLDCTNPVGYTTQGGDCDDTNPNIYPDALEICDNGIDDDCDGAIDGDDSDVAAVMTWYEDSDGDGYGNNESSVLSCGIPQGYVTDSTDCDDTRSTSNPNGIEVCNGIDDDCDGLIDINDPDISGVGLWFADLDGDGYGDPDNTIQECTQPSGYLPNNEDCDDANAEINPAAVEICNDVDDNCDGQIDELDPNATGGEFTWYLDADEDGYGDPTTSIDDCDQPAGYIAIGNDCNDGDASINPTAIEIPNNGIDEDCDGLDSTTSASTYTETKLRLYPNPLQDYLSIEFGNEVCEVIIYNTQGQIVRSFHRLQLSARVNLSMLENGAYLIALTPSSSAITHFEKLLILK